MTDPEEQYQATYDRWWASLTPEERAAELAMMDAHEGAMWERQQRGESR